MPLENDRIRGEEEEKQAYFQEGLQKYFIFEQKRIFSGLSARENGWL